MLPGAIPLAAITALQALRTRGKLQPGEKVLVQGASGGVGSFAVQIAKALGGEVIAVCSARNRAAVLSFGASRAIDYRMNASCGRRVETLALEQSREDLLFIKGLLEEGKVLPTIDASFPLERVADAFRLYEKDHAQGKIVITMENKENWGEPR